MATPTITTLPPAPQRTDLPATFSQKADTFVAALPGFATEVNNMITWVDGINTNMENVLGQAQAARDDAQTAKAGADDGATLSMNWATQLETVVDGDYSSKEWAIGIDVPTGSAKQWATSTAAIGAEYSSKEWAIGSADGGSSKDWAIGTRDDGSAKQWATSVTAIGGEFSARQWAIGAIEDVPGGSAKYHKETAEAAAAAAQSAAGLPAIAGKARHVLTVNDTEDGVSFTPSTNNIDGATGAVYLHNDSQFPSLKGKDPFTFIENGGGYTNILLADGWQIGAIPNEQFQKFEGPFITDHGPFPSDVTLRPPVVADFSTGGGSTLNASLIQNDPLVFGDNVVLIQPGNAGGIVLRSFNTVTKQIVTDSISVTTENYVTSMSYNAAPSIFKISESRGVVIWTTATEFERRPVCRVFNIDSAGVITLIARENLDDNNRDLIDINQPGNVIHLSGTRFMTATKTADESGPMYTFIRHVLFEFDTSGNLVPLGFYASGGGGRYFTHWKLSDDKVLWVRISATSTNSGINVQVIDATPNDVKLHQSFNITGGNNDTTTDGSVWVVPLVEQQKFFLWNRASSGILNRGRILEWNGSAMSAGDIYDTELPLTQVAAKSQHNATLMNVFARMHMYAKPDYLLFGAAKFSISGDVITREPGLLFGATSTGQIAYAKDMLGNFYARSNSNPNPPNTSYQLDPLTSDVSVIESIQHWAALVYVVTPDYNNRTVKYDGVPYSINFTGSVIATDAVPLTESLWMGHQTNKFVIVGPMDE